MKLLLVLSVALFASACSNDSAKSGSTSHESEIRKEQEATLKALQGTYEKTLESYSKSSGDSVAKGALVSATVRYATAVMYGPGAPRQKYPRALELYEDALELDPDNEEAKRNRQMILDIYKGMGKAPPKPGA